MGKSCNGIGCAAPLDCDNCRQMDCQIEYYCDSCGEEVDPFDCVYGEHGEMLCPDCSYEIERW
ncbi:MAG: hypothetical protein LUH82_02145 [Clostridiales bacterium]|nr:hypothetical protein [Clostridiales bacterium]